ncbi:MAG: MmgE/PrpD family protein, partial [Actinobacteria bacterium]|nr:MmgE/PrpD family protein [Actinomycetota bacterium]
LALLVVGYELATRAGIAMHATAVDYHSSGSWGAVGAAAVGARVLGLDHEAMFEAMGIAEYHGPRSQMMRVVDHPTMVKDGSAWGAMTGVSAAYLAASGFTGAPAILTNDPALDWLWADLGTRWIIHEQYFKPQPVCRWAQPAVEAALELCRAHDFASGDVVGIEVATFHEASRLSTALPTTTEQAQYSLPFPVGAAIAKGRVGPSEVGSAALSDPEIVRLAGLVSLVEDDAHNAAFPANRFARVTLSLRDGRRLESADTEPRGDPEDHLDDAEIRAKFLAYASPILGRSRSAAIEAAVDGLDTAESLRPFLGLVTGPIEALTNR